MKKITISDLRAFPTYEAFGHGGTNLLQWVAYKLPNHMWTIYIGTGYETEKEIIEHEHTFSLTTAKKLINCTDEVWERYTKGGEK